MKFPKEANPHREKVDSWVPGAEVGRLRSDYLMGTRLPFREIKYTEQYTDDDYTTL